jgi:hypothetical protein
MKKLLRFLTVALVTGACTCSWAVDYANHFYDQRVYRVALGSGTAPTAADMNTIRLHNGDMVLNTDDDVLYIMHATNVYTKITAAGAMTINSSFVTDGSTIGGVATSTTSRTSINIQPVAASSRSGVSRQSLVTIGDITGTTPFGFGVTNQSSYGLMASFGRTIAATANWDGNYDTGLDVRCLNKLVNDSAYNMRGAYIKAKNYISGGVTGVVGQLDGLTVECVADGTETESSIVKLGSDASTVTYGIDMDDVATPATADIRFSNGALIKNGDANTLTITEATVAISGALTATTVTPANGTSVVVTCASTLSTNVLYFLNGILTNKVYTGP